MLLRNLFVCVGLVLLVLLERLGYYAARGDLVIFMTGSPQEGGLGMSQSSALELFGMWAGLLYLMPLLGGVVAIFTGPRVPLVLGTVLAALGFWALGSVSAAPLMLPLALVTLGQGLLKPSLYAVAADELPHPRDGGRDVLFIAMYVAINLGASLSGMVSVPLAQQVGHSGLFLAVSVLMGAAALVAGGVVALQRFMAQPPPASPGAHSMKGVGVLLVLALPYMLGQEAAGSVQLRFLQGELSSQGAMLNGFAPMVVAVAGVVLAAVLAGLAAAGRTVPTLLPVAAGLTLFSAGGALLFFSQGTGNPWPPLIASTLMQSLAEVLIWPLLYSSVVAGAPRRFAPLVFAGFVFVAMLLGKLPFFTQGSFEAQRALLGLSVVGCAVSAGVLFARWRRMTQWFLPPTPRAATAGALEARPS